MKLQKLKEQVIDIITNGFVEEGMFEVVNGQGGVEDTLTLQQVNDLVAGCSTRQALHNLVLVDWMMGDVYTDLEDFIGEFV